MCVGACVCVWGRVSVCGGVCMCVGACVCVWGRVSVCGGVCMCVGACVCVWGRVYVCGGVCMCVDLCEFFIGPINLFTYLLLDTLPYDISVWTVSGVLMVKRGGCDVSSLIPPPLLNPSPSLPTSIPPLLPLLPRLPLLPFLLPSSPPPPPSSSPSPSSLLFPLPLLPLHQDTGFNK